MANLTQPLLHGYINHSHTTNVTAFYPPQSLPTPWPLAVASLILTLTISCYGTKLALLSWSDKTRRNVHSERPKGQTWVGSFREHLPPYSLYKTPSGKKREPVVCESELDKLQHGVESGIELARTLEDLGSEDLHGDLGLQVAGDKPPGYSESQAIQSEFSAIDSGRPVGNNFAELGTSQHGLAAGLDYGRRTSEAETETDRESQVEGFWRQYPLSMKIMMITICAYCTLRAVVAVITTLEGIISDHSAPSAPSILLLILVSTQIFTSNRDLPRIMNLIFTIDTLLLSIAFLLASYAPLSGGKIRSYGELSLMGGSCPIAASDCQSQSTHWSVVGCGNYTYFQDLEDNDGDAIPESRFYAPYATSADMNIDGNALHVVEAVISVFGTIWLITVLFHIYEIRHLFTTPIKKMLQPLGPTPNRRCGSTLMVMVTMLGIIGVFVATIMSIAGHMSQELGSHHATYIDSLGPGVWANYTTNSLGIATSIEYWGNSTSWNDCFDIQAPTSVNGFWNEWVAQNGVRLYRVAAGL